MEERHGLMTEFNYHLISIFYSKHPGGICNMCIYCKWIICIIWNNKYTILYDPWDYDYVWLQYGRKKMLSVIRIKIQGFWTTPLIRCQQWSCIAPQSLGCQTLQTDIFLELDIIFKNMYIMVSFPVSVLTCLAHRLSSREGSWRKADGSSCSQACSHHSKYNDR